MTFKAVDAFAPFPAPRDHIGQHVHSARWSEVFWSVQIPECKLSESVRAPNLWNNLLSQQSLSVCLLLVPTFIDENRVSSFFNASQTFTFCPFHPLSACANRTAPQSKVERGDVSRGESRWNL